MGKLPTTIAIVLVSISSAWIALGWLGVLMATPLLLFCLYLIWFDSKKPWNEQLRFFKQQECTCTPPKEACNVCGGLK